MHRRGFTLIELLVVISIIGILSGIIVAGLNGARVSARDAKRISDIKNIQLALAQYYFDQGHYPCKLQGSTGVGCTPAFEGVYMAEVPEDPQGVAYKYTGLVLNATPTITLCNANGGVSRYILGAELEGTSNQNLQQDETYTINSSTGVITINSQNFGSCQDSELAFHHSSTDCAYGTYSAGSPEGCYNVGP
jgi:type II secretion system protein G